MDFLFIYKEEENYTAGLVKNNRWIRREVFFEEDKRDNLYICRILQDLKGQRAYIIEYEKNEKGFLPYGQTRSERKPGEELILQYTKEGKGKKLARFTENYLIIGDKIQLTPWTGEIRLSGKAYQNHNIELSEKEYGMIIRRKGILSSVEELEAEYEQLAVIADRILTEKNFLPIPRLLLKQNKTLLQFLNQYDEEVSMIKTNDPKLKNLLQGRKGKEIIIDPEYIPAYDEALQRDYLNIDSTEIRLDAESSIFFEKTEAFAVIDVNLNASKEKMGEKILQTNLNAVFETAVQMELRDLTGIAVMDCINMNGSMKKEFSRQTKEILKEFPRMKYHGITSLNLAQFVRTGIKSIDS